MDGYLEREHMPTSTQRRAGGDSRGAIRQVRESQTLYHATSEPDTPSPMDFAADADGLVNLLSNQPRAHCSHQVALVVAPGFDFHWYRLDDNGMWSHKPGSTPVRNVDNSNNPISDPRTADRGPYMDFYGFLCVCKCKVTIN